MSDKIYMVADESWNNTTRDLGILKPPADFAPWSDTLKITGFKKNVVVHGIAIYGGVEDAADENNRCDGVDIHFDHWYSGGRYCSTVKGGSKNARRSGCIVRQGKYAVAVGEFSDQNNDPVTGLRLNHWTTDGSKVRVLLCNCTDPIYENGREHYDVIDVRGWKFKLWLFFKELFPKWL